MDVIKKFEPLFGEWYVESFIGAGSFGRVYKICREEFGEKFYSALKYISIPYDPSDVMQLKMEGMDEASISTYYTSLTKGISAETRLMNKLRGNTNIVSFEDSRIVQKPGGVGYDIFIRMELLTGLPSRIVKAPFTRLETAKLGTDILKALMVCGQYGIIHRDIKPDNIFISNTGDYKLGDFGIARQLEKTATFMSRKGTPNYMAPEVYKGEKYGANCDIYSLGMVMYRLMNNGRLPFMPPAPKPIEPDDREQSLLLRFSGKPLPAPCEADPELSRIILKACAFDPAERYAEANEMYDDLLRYSLAQRNKPVPGRGSYAPIPKAQKQQEKRPEPSPEATAAIFRGDGDRPVQPEGTVGVKRQANPAHTALVPEYAPAKAQEELPAQNKKVSKAIRIGIIVATVVIVIAIAGIIWLLIKDNSSGCVSKREDSSIKLEDNDTGHFSFSGKQPTVEQYPDESDCYLVTVFVENGTKVVYETAAGIRQEATIENDDKIQFKVPKGALMPGEPIEGSTIRVQPKVYIRNADGTETFIDSMPFIELSVPGISVYYDCTDAFDSYDGEAVISGKIDQIYAKLRINGEDVSIASDGSFSHTVRFSAVGIHNVPVEARSGGCQVYRHSFSVNVRSVKAASALIEFPWEYGNTVFSQRISNFNDTIEVRGKVPAGSTLEAACDSSNAALTAPAVGEDGSFTFSAKLAFAGDYVIHLKCTTESGQISERDVHVQRAPNWSTYTSGAYQMNYASFAYEATQAYRIKGTVTEILQEGDYILAVLETADGNKLVIEYHNHYGSAGKIEVGKSYESIYGRPMGMGLNDLDLPQIYVWFVDD
jgi:serine/threonine protein kinase